MSGAPNRAIQMIGMDLDGTLLGPDGAVAAAEREALEAAADAGVVVVPCTGRAHHEAAGALAEMPGLDLGVFATGATITRLADGAVLDAVHFAPETAAELVEALRPLPDAVLVYSVRGRTGVDYTVTGDGELTPNTRWWFEHTSAAVRHVRHMDEADLAHVVRVAVVSNSATLQPHLDALFERFAGRIEAHSFGGVERTVDNPVQILEAFPPGVTKWRGLRWAADHLGIDPGCIGVVGDEVNDLPAFRDASLAVAMGNAVPAVQELADHVVADNRSGGAAEAIRWLLAR